MGRGGLGAVLGVPVLVGALACESQVGEDYEGEVQLSIEGTVHTDDSGLEPRLAFRAGDGLALVEGEVTGSFPSQFRFDVTKPPPEDTLHSDESIPGSARAPASRSSACSPSAAAR